MLVLARSEGQTVVLDDRIVVTVLESRDGLVRLGIDAPREVGVRRGELDPLRVALPASPAAAPAGSSGRSAPDM